MYVIPDFEAILVLDDPPYEGAEATVRLNVPYGALREVRAWLRSYQDAQGTDEEEAYEAAVRLFTQYALKSWTLADEHGPVPATAEAMLERVPMSLGAALIVTWVGHVGRAPGPLSPGSRSTEPPAPDTTNGSPSGESSEAEPSPSTP